MGDNNHCDYNDESLPLGIEERGRIDLAAAYRLCEYMNLNEGVCNHLSYMIDDESFLVIAHGLSWDEVTPKNLLLVDERGNVLKGKGVAEPTAFYIHSRIHKGTNIYIYIYIG